jgi:hypothetical protein
LSVVARPTKQIADLPPVRPIEESSDFGTPGPGPARPASVAPEGSRLRRAWSKAASAPEPATGPSGPDPGALPPIPVARIAPAVEYPAASRRPVEVPIVASFPRRQLAVRTEPDASDTGVGYQAPVPTPAGSNEPDTIPDETMAVDEGDDLPPEPVRGVSYLNMPTRRSEPVASDPEPVRPKPTDSPSPPPRPAHRPGLGAPRRRVMEGPATDAGRQDDHPQPAPAPPVAESTPTVAVVERVVEIERSTVGEPSSAAPEGLSASSAAEARSHAASPPPSPDPSVTESAEPASPPVSVPRVGRRFEPAVPAPEPVPARTSAAPNPPTKPGLVHLNPRPRPGLSDPMPATRVLPGRTRPAPASTPPPSARVQVRSADIPVDVPTQMREQIRQVTGADVGNVRVHRGPAASARAASVGAAAFAQGENVVLPASLGPLSDDRAKGLLAHELTHVVQQRRFRGDLPDESSAAGRALEEQAQVVERHIRDHHHEPTPVVSTAPAPEPVAAPEPAPVADDLPPAVTLSAEEQQAISAAAHDLVASGLAGAGSDGVLYFGPAREEMEGHPGRELQGPPLGLVDMVGALPGASRLAPGTPVGAPGTPSGTRFDLTSASPVGMQRAVGPADFGPVSESMPSATPASPVMSQLMSMANDATVVDSLGADSPPSSLPSSAAAAPEAPATDEADPEPQSQNRFQMPNERDLDELSKRLYHRLRRQLKNELVIDRERSGLIADLR